MAGTYSKAQTYIHKKREVHLFLTLFKGFAIPVLSRKTTEVHARYVSPTSPYDGRGAYLYIPTGHSLLLSGLSTKFCEDSEESQTTFTINAFYYVIPFYVSDLTLSALTFRRGRIFCFCYLCNFRLQSYDFFTTYASFCTFFLQNTKKNKIAEFSCICQKKAVILRRKIELI